MVVKNNYLLWLKAALEYYHPKDGYGEDFMSDEMWTMLAQYYFQHIEHFPFLQDIDFNGTTLGVGVTKQQLEDEIKAEIEFQERIYELYN